LRAQNHLGIGVGLGKKRSFNAQEMRRIIKKLFQQNFQRLQPLTRHGHGGIFGGARQVLMYFFKRHFMVGARGGDGHDNWPVFVSAVGVVYDHPTQNNKMNAQQA
jgi:hypothetical protein